MRLCGLRRIDVSIPVQLALLSLDIDMLWQIPSWHDTGLERN